MAEAKPEELVAFQLVQSGRCVLIRKLGLRAMEAADDRAHSGFPQPDQLGKREGARRRDMVMQALHSITLAPVDPVLVEKKKESESPAVNVKATVDSVVGANAGGGWTKLSYLELSGDGERSFYELFEDSPLDMTQLTNRVEDLANRPRGGWGKPLPLGDVTFVAG